MPHGTKRSGLGPFRNRVIALPRATKRRLMQAADIVLIPLCIWVALAVTHNSILLGLQQPAALYVTVGLASVLIFYWLGLYRAITRFIDFRSLVSVLTGAA